jgi:hypothetical protein
MFIETRFYDNGRTDAGISKQNPVGKRFEHPSSCDYYLDEVGDLQEWIENSLEIELDDVVPFVLALDAGDWVDISAYI